MPMGRPDLGVRGQPFFRQDRIEMAKWRMEQRLRPRWTPLPNRSPGGHSQGMTIDPKFSSARRCAAGLARTRRADRWFCRTACSRTAKINWIKFSTAARIAGGAIASSCDLRVHRSAGAARRFYPRRAGARSGPWSRTLISPTSISAAFRSAPAPAASARSSRG